MQYGIDYLGGARYQRLILETHPAGWAAGFFVQRDLFGDPTPVIRRLAESGKCPIIRINLGWRDDHRFSDADVRAIVERAKRWAPIIARYPKVQWYVSGATEHTLNAEKANALASRVIRTLPLEAIYVNNPMGTLGSLLPTNERVYNEVHGTKESPPRSGKFLFSYDGSNCVDDDIEARKRTMRKAEVFFFWHPAMNGRLTVADTTPRAARKGFPTRELVESINYFSNSRGTGIKTPANWIWKSHADRHDTPPEPRAYKPVLICPEKASVMRLVAPNGTVIKTSTPPQSFHDGRWRYYFYEFGYVLAEKSRQNGGSVVQVVGDNKILGYLNPAFRAGSFRD
jgi:hypothetical protein